jgi:tRNA A-37 threonylcarbamoyl transferase component Bud32
MMEMLDFVMKWAVAPVIIIGFGMYNRQQKHDTDIAVLKATASANKEAHDREFKQIQDSFKAVFTKLDGIEEALRK